MTQNPTPHGRRSLRLRGNGILVLTDVGAIRTRLSEVVGAFKSLTTVDYIRGVKAKGWPEFHGRLWQRNYYEHVVRDETELNRIRQTTRRNGS